MKTRMTGKEAQEIIRWMLKCGMRTKDIAREIGTRAATPERWLRDPPRVLNARLSMRLLELSRRRGGELTRRRAYLQAVAVAGKPATHTRSPSLKAVSRRSSRHRFPLC